MLRVGAAMVPVSWDKEGLYLAKTYRWPGASGFGDEYEAKPANDSIQVAVVGSIWGFGDETDGTVIDCIQFAE